MANLTHFDVHGVKSVEVMVYEGRYSKAEGVDNTGRLSLRVLDDEGNETDICLFSSRQAGLRVEFPAAAAGRVVDPGGRPTDAEEMAERMKKIRAEIAAEEAAAKGE